MPRVLLILGLLSVTVGPVRSNLRHYPPLTRESLVGTWEGVFGIGTLPIVFHIVIAPGDEDSYLAVVYPEDLHGRVYRLNTCRITDAKVYLRFLALPGDDSLGWWIEGEGYGDANTAWINGRIGSGWDAGNSSESFFYLAKGTWVRTFGDASRRGEDMITSARDAKK
jgi:hypothetical protein